MIKYLAIIFSLVFVAPAMAVPTEIHYLTNAGSGTRIGTLANPFAWADLADSGKWDAAIAVDNKIGPNDTVCLSGAISTANSTNHNIYNPNDSTPTAGEFATNAITIDGTGTGDCDAADAVLITGSGSPTTYRYLFRSSGGDYLIFKGITTATIAGPIECAGGAGSICAYWTIQDNNFAGLNQGIQGQYGEFENWTLQDNVWTARPADTGCSSCDGFRMSYGNNVTIQRDTYIDFGHNGVAITAEDDTTNIIVRNCKFTLPTKGYGRAIGFSAYAGIDLSYINIYNNYIYGMRARSQLENLNHAYIYNNIFYNQLNTCLNADDDDCTIQYWNWAAKVGGQTGQAWELSTLGGALDYIYILNNTFYKAAESIFRIVPSVADIDNLHIENNIIYLGSNASSSTEDSPPGSTNTTHDLSLHINTDGITFGTYTVTNFTFKNNIFLSKRGAGNDEIQWGTNFYTVTEFEALSGRVDASGNIEENPDLTDPDNEDYTLGENSPAINAGLTLDADAFLPTTSLPPAAATIGEQDSYGAGWEIGAFIYDDTPEAPTDSTQDGLSLSKLIRK